VPKPETAPPRFEAAPLAERSRRFDRQMGFTDEGNPEFDKSARDYEELFRPWLRIVGSPREYFARARLQWLSDRLLQQAVTPDRVMDFGCGTGMSLPLLADILHAKEVLGLDTSEESLAVAREAIENRPVELATPTKYIPRQDLDLVFCNGVFHHIPVAERPAAVDYVYRCLRPGGMFALWENNPWNPVQSFAMKHSAIDRNAIPLPALESRRLLAAGGFRVLRTDYLFICPGYLSWLRPLEKWLVKMPLGAQYEVLACKE
jgi:SAM-dependent methyltransferase